MAGINNIASLRIFSETLSREQIAEALQTVPTLGHNKGDLVSRHSPVARYWTHSFWRLEALDDEPNRLDSCIETLVAFCEEKSEALNRLRNDCGIDIFCGFFSDNGQSGFTLDADLIARLARLGLGVTFDMYLPATDTETE